MRLTNFTVAVLAIVAGPLTASEVDSIAAGKDAWARRAEGRSGAVAAAEPIADAVAAFEQALAHDPGDLSARAWLLKALWFQGEHTSTDTADKLVIFEQARDLAQEAIDELAATVGGDPREMSGEALERLRGIDHAADVYFWGAAHWGLWGRYRGKIASARQGVAGKIRDYAEITIALDDRLENAGGHRILGRLHTEAPKLPFVTGWIDRDEAVRQLELAVEIAPHDLMNQLYLLEAIIEFEPSRRSSAIDRLRTFAETEPDPETLVEDLKIQDDARLLLRRHE